MGSGAAYVKIDYLPLAAAVVRQSGEILHANPLFEEVQAAVGGAGVQDFLLQKFFKPPLSEDLAGILLTEWARHYVIGELNFPPELGVHRFEVALSKIEQEKSAPLVMVVFSSCTRVSQNFESDVNTRALLVSRVLTWQYNFKNHDFFVTGDLSALIGYTSEETTPFNREMWDRLVEQRLMNNLPPVMWDSMERSDYRDYLRVRHKNGSLVWIAIRGTVTHRDEDGSPLLMLGLMGDLQADAFNLDALLSAREAAEADVKKRTDFISSLSHEIRTPLNSLIGMTHVLAEAETDLFKRERLQQLNDSSKGLLNTLNGLLEHAKLTDYGLSLIAADFELLEAIKSTIAIFTQPAQQKNIRLSYSIGDDVPGQIYSDKLKITQIINNLLSNAVKFTPEGEITLVVELENAGKDSAKLLIAIKDEGIGLSEAEQNNIFEPFYQSEHSVNHRHGGTGLGLSISRQLAECLGGTLTVFSRLGAGSTFTLALPMAIIRPANPCTPVHEDVVGIRQLTTPTEAYQTFKNNKPVESAALINKLKLLIKKLASFDLAAPNISNELRTNLAGSELEADYTVIHEKVASLRFDLAEQLVAKFVANFEEK